MWNNSGRGFGSRRRPLLRARGIGVVMRPVPFSLCRHRLLATGILVAGIYLFLFVVISTRHLDPNFRSALSNVVHRAPRATRSPSAGLRQPSAVRQQQVASRQTPAPPSPLGPASGAAGGQGLSAVRLFRSRLSSRSLVFCSNMTYRHPPGISTALASFPGSGNTWLRYLVQQATGLYTGSVYRDQALLRHGFPAENVSNGSVVLVKTHEWGKAVKERFGAAVLLVRDPYAAIMAEFNRQSGGHIGHATLDKYVVKKGKVWKEFVMGKSRSWLETNLDWLVFDGPVLVITYEELVSTVETELRRVLLFLGLPEPKEKTWSCVLTHKEGIYKRQPRDLHFDPFDEDMRTAIERYKQYFFTAMRLLQDGYRLQMIDFVNSVLHTL